MRHNRSQRGSTRSHHALSPVSITKCPECGQPTMRHQACSNCGKYRGKTVINFDHEKPAGLVAGKPAKTKSVKK